MKRERERERVLLSLWCHQTFVVIEAVPDLDGTRERRESMRLSVWCTSSKLQQEQALKLSISIHKMLKFLWHNQSDPWGCILISTKMFHVHQDWDDRIQLPYPIAFVALEFL
jgi:hypothetical protein